MNGDKRHRFELRIENERGREDSDSGLGWLFVSDVDDTLLGDDETLGQLASILAATEGVTLVFNSSRPCASLRASLTAVPHLPRPDYLIGGMGTQIEVAESGERLAGYEEYLGEGWDRAAAAGLVAGLGAVAHEEKYQTPFKVSYDVTAEAFAIVKERLASSGLAAKAIFSAGKFLDIIAARAGKGEAIGFLRRELGFTAERVVVAGDSGNDVEMFVAPFRGIVVGNADQDLKAVTGDHIYQAERPYAGGLLEGLYYWGVVNR